MSCEFLERLSSELSAILTPSDWIGISSYGHLGGHSIDGMMSRGSAEAAELCSDFRISEQPTLVAPPPTWPAMETPMETPDDPASSPEPDTKRRKLRKGTKSCWDCKKRKVRCTFDATSDTVCIACRRRGAPCVGQDHPEEEAQTYAAGNRGTYIYKLATPIFEVRDITYLRGCSVCFEGFSFFRKNPF